jgi:very-short-patch-repair endonuclease
MRNERGFIGPNHSWPAKRERAKELRRAATPAEKFAWRLLRPYRVEGCTFRRQQVIDGFIVDFFCATLRLVIELDGEIHNEIDVREQDAARDTHLGQLGLTIVRVPNAEVSAKRLGEIVQQRKASLGSPLPRQGEGDRG